MYSDEKSSQITALAVSGSIVYLGTANPAKLILVSSSYAETGEYESDLIDGNQPSHWGKLQIEADIPTGCKVMVSSRSGNLKDVNDPTFSDWTKAQPVVGPVQLNRPLGRYCQYKLSMSTSKATRTPIIQEVAVANTIPNLAPKVVEVTVGLAGKSEKRGIFEINCKANDDNGDTLIYKIDMRKVGRVNWIELEEKTDKPSFEWDGRTVEDGRYEIRVTASDELSNSISTRETGSRVSEAVVVDNTGPKFEFISMSNSESGSLAWPVEIVGDDTQIQLTVYDELSSIGALQ